MADDRKPPPLDFDAQAVDQLAALVEAWRGQPVLANLDYDDAKWVLGILKKYAELEPITSGKQCRSYRRRFFQIWRAKLGRHGDRSEVVAAFMRTPDGAAALALGCRIDEWQKQRGARVKGLWPRDADWVIAEIRSAIRAAEEVWRNLTGGN
jgi:hypothetical protein